LIEIIDWAYENVTSTLCSCLATHAVLQFRHGQKRRLLPKKRWGVFSHEVMDRLHPLVKDVNTRFDVPHSRFNEVFPEQFAEAGLKVLVESREAGVHLAVSEDGFRVVYFQGHPEYDTISLLKEYKREVMRYANEQRSEYPPFPDNYLGIKNEAILDEYREKLLFSMKNNKEIPLFPEDFIHGRLDNTWHDSAEAMLDNWIGQIYLLTNQDRSLPFMEGVDPKNPLGL